MIPAASGFGLFTGKQIFHETMKLMDYFNTSHQAGIKAGIMCFDMISMRYM